MILNHSQTGVAGSTKRLIQSFNSTRSTTMFDQDDRMRFQVIRQCRIEGIGWKPIELMGKLLFKNKYQTKLEADNDSFLVVWKRILG